jgi:hypothetical protein
LKRSILAFALTVAGCGFVRPTADAPALGELVLHRALHIEAGHARAFLQGGASIPKGGLNEYDTNCELVSNRMFEEQDQDIQPDRFAVIGVARMFGSVVQAGTVRLASLASIGGDDSGSSFIHYGYHFWLRSATQPDVIRLTCRGELGVPSDVDYPTRAEIDAALGGVARLELGAPLSFLPSRLATVLPAVTLAETRGRHDIDELVAGSPRRQGNDTRISAKPNPFTSTGCT